MRILIDIGHPAHVHQFRNAIHLLEARGHDVLVTSRNKEVTFALLDKYSIPYVKVGDYANNNIKKAINMFKIDAELYSVTSKFQPDILIGGVGNVYIAHVSWLLRRPSILFNDTEHGKLQDQLSYPFTTTICTPSCYTRDLGEKQVRYNGYHELAYLHPDRFTPNPAVLTELGLAEGDPFIIVRFVSWEASHDVGQHGIHDKVGLVKALEQYGRVLITSEGALPEELQPYQIRVSPEKLHDLLYYATLYVGDGGTTASEAAVLGTPAIFISTLYCGYQLDEEKYGLLYLFSDPVSGVKNGLRKAVALLNDPNLKENAYLNRLKLLEDKIDVTEFMVWFVENYPESCHQIKADPEKQYPLATS
jgi:predicted glycosyltransferase